MKNFILILVLTFAFKTLPAQNLVGMSSENILSFLKSKGITQDSIEVGNNTNGSAYISYENTRNKFIYFLDSTMICYCYRVVYQNSELNNVIKRFNEKFVPDGHYKWLNYDHENFVVILEQKEGYFVTDLFLK